MPKAKSPSKTKTPAEVKTQAKATVKPKSPAASRRTPDPKRAKQPAPSSVPVKEAELVEPSEVFDPELIHSEFLPGDPDGEHEFIEMKEIDPDSGEIPDLAELAEISRMPKVKRKAGSQSAALTTASDSKALTTPDPVATYLAEIRRYSLLTREQEQELAIRYREHGDAKAAEALVTSNLRFVVKIAAEYSRFGAKLIDLIQEGNVGLMHAVKEFNPYKGVRLITYAVWWIRGYIQEYLMRQYSMVRIGTTQNQRKLFYKLQKEKQLIDSLGQEPNYALLSSRLGVTEEEVETMTKRLSGRDLSLSQPVDSSGESAATLLDFESTGEPGADVQIGNQEELQVLNENIEKIRPQLSSKETYILEKRVLADEPQTLQEIGEHFGTTREAVRQLEARLIGKIRTAVTTSLSHDLGKAEHGED